MLSMTVTKYWVMRVGGLDLNLVSAHSVAAWTGLSKVMQITSRYSTQHIDKVLTLSAGCCYLK